MKGNILTYIKKLILSDSKESSKRFIAIYTMLLITFIVVAYTNKDNSVIVLTTLCGFVLTLVSVASWQSAKNNQNKNNE
jgi:succinate-acetate transporter protein